ncbi:MAG: hypothetical protein GY774_37745 [Planctomycetes bacterium]|nr:hypothetical protein [Planctomycetota bacterium]
MKRRDMVLILMFLLIGTSMVNAQEIVNLFDNPGFEEGEGIEVQDIPGWQLYKQEEATGLLTIDTEEAIEGNQCVFIEVTGVPAGGTWNLRFDHMRRFSVEQGTTYTMSFWLKGDAGPIILSASRAEQNAAGQWGNLAQEIVNPTAEWEEYHLTFESPEDRLVMWQLLISNPEQTYYVDHARCYVGEYVPGRIGQPTQAYDPIPDDGTLHPDTWVNLSWKPGDKAVSHDVYFSDNFDLVQDGAAEAFQGNQGEDFFVVGFPGMPFPDGLVNGTTYYWRIDEVNEADPNSPWKGPVWSFGVPPKTAYAPDPANAAEQVNLNETLRWTGGFGSKVHTLYFGDNFDDVNNAQGGLPQAATTYDPGPLELAQTYYWRVDEFDIIETHKGNIWSFTTEGAVGNPEPANGAVDVDRTQIITWSPNVFAASHEVYFGTDKDTVKNADTGSPEYKGTRALGDEIYDPGKLELATTYYWRIDEVNSPNPDSPWPGLLWSFTTADFLVVDDMESYNDIDEGEPDSNRIYLTWVDGFDNPAVNGSIVGHANSPFAEQTIVHDGIQSMPFVFDNAVGKSEATLTLTYPRDWTEDGAGTLSIWFRGNSDNAAEQMYVALNGSAVVNHDNPDAAKIRSWTEWTIDLQSFAGQGVDLTNVNTITIGFGNRNNPTAGGSGMMFFDDIRLYAP